MKWKEQSQATQQRENDILDHGDEHNRALRATPEDSDAEFEVNDDNDILNDSDFSSPLQPGSRTGDRGFFMDEGSAGARKHTNANLNRRAQQLRD